MVIRDRGGLVYMKYYDINKLHDLAVNEVKSLNNYKSNDCLTDLWFESFNQTWSNTSKYDYVPGVVSGQAFTDSMTTVFCMKKLNVKDMLGNASIIVVVMFDDIFGYLLEYRDKVSDKLLDDVDKHFLCGIYDASNIYAKYDTEVICFKSKHVSIYERN